MHSYSDKVKQQAGQTSNASKRIKQAETMGSRATVNNFNISNARSIADRYFESNVFEVKLIKNKFVLWLYKEVKEEKLKEFMNLYPEFDVLIGKFEPYQLNPKQ